jgi:NAD(P)-dependent dehydrogenase (short-subunit alcohol dehydrogenase family)
VTAASDGPVAVLTGGGGNLGHTLGEMFLERGYRLAVIDIDPEALAWTEGRANVLTVVGDVTKPEVNDDLAESTLAEFGRIDAALFNIGLTGNPGLEEDGALERFDAIMELNVRAVVLGARAIIPAMRKAGTGSIVATSSISGFGAEPGLWAYNASKAAVINLVHAFAFDYGPYGVRVNAVCPGPIRPANLEERSEVVQERYRALARHLPLQRVVYPHEVAEAIYFLASAAASGITGETLQVDGGVRAGSGLFLPRPATAGPPTGHISHRHL